uniref:Uncharacterized protein n=1 Tax=Chromera velia CCMP2878 TaxID=1169474 RepID=A0A0G4GNW7_9ALVE|eukprot:Cvel_22741.t1-p1 / transcript=Cvel_22741.t1 / gene=Cvel_22741 / organism=Chromera_velia_CCMP2878 / gene_product=hypothetical protein / transcript_product=hypothetical protein / location=Cvel_scaffold2268:15706-17134(-) / protein_length=315 / sequence_SO=supercontig / SO=protein_coding / is_pseudo=false
MRTKFFKRFPTPAEAAKTTPIPKGTRKGRNNRKKKETKVPAAPQETPSSSSKDIAPDVDITSSAKKPRASTKLIELNSVPPKQRTDKAAVLRNAAKNVGHVEIANKCAEVIDAGKTLVRAVRKLKESYKHGLTKHPSTDAKRSHLLEEIIRYVIKSIDKALTERAVGKKVLLFQDGIPMIVWDLLYRCVNVEQKLYNVEQIAQEALQLAKVKGESGGREGVKPIVYIEGGHILQNYSNVYKVCYYLWRKNQKKGVMNNCNILHTEDECTAEAKEVREAIANIASSSRGSRGSGGGRGGRNSSSSSGYNGSKSWYH